jgi:uncharacterized coiled-coil DUF342 family protein
MTAREKHEKVEALRKLLATSSDIDDEIAWLKKQRKMFDRKAVNLVGGAKEMRRLINAAKGQSKGRGLDGAVELPWP